jgi:hypothetical protein
MGLIFRHEDNIMFIHVIEDRLRLTGVFVRTQAACFTQTPLQSWKHSVSWVTLVWEALLIQPASLSCVHSGFPINEKHLGVVCICVHVRHVHSQFTIATQMRKKLLYKL